MSGQTTLSFMRALGVAALCGLCAAAGRGGERAYTLEEIIGLGRERNPRVAAAALEASAREAAYQAARRLANPELAFHLGRAESHDLPVSRHTFGLAVAQTIENPVKRRHRLDMARKDWEESRQTHAGIVLEADFEIKTRYYGLLHLEKRESLLKKTAESVRRMHRLVAARAALGEVRPLDAVKLLVEALQAEKELAAVRAESDQARDDLNVLLGGALPPDFAVAGELVFRPVPADAEALIARALEDHPYVLEKARALERAQSRVGFVRAQRFPDLTLKGFSDSGLDGVNRGVQFELAVPLWNFRGWESAEATRLLLKEEKERDAARLEIAGGIRSCLRRVRLAEETLAVFTGALLDQVEQSLEVAAVGYREGEISLLEFLDTQRTHDEVLGDYYRALLAWNTEMAALEKAAGVRLR